MHLVRRKPRTRMAPLGAKMTAKRETIASGTSRRVMRFAMITAGAAAVGISGCAQKPPHKSTAVSVALASVTQGNVVDERVGLGRVEAFNSALVRAQASGQIIKLMYTEGQSVVAGQPIAQIDPRPLEATLARDVAIAAKDQASLDNAVRLVNRNAPLAPNGVVSGELIDAQRTQAAELRATVAADAAVVRQDRLQLSYTTIRATAAGVTGLRLKDIGDLVGPTDAQGLVTIAQVQPIAVLFTLPQTDLAAIRSHMNAAGANGLRVDVYAQGGATRLDSGRLLMIDNIVDQTTGTVTLKAVFPNASKQFWPGELVNAHIVLEQRPNALTAPTSAVQRDDHGTYAWVIDAKGSAHPTPVTVGAALGDRTVIESGLRKDDRVVTDGQFALLPGARVAPVAKAGPASPAMKSVSPSTLDAIP
jgi:multidrug efflux system membrane fusion protein